MAVTQVNRIEELARFQSSWDRLLSQTEGASFFQSLDWLRVYWRHFGRNQELRVLVQEFENQVVGILPLTIRREWTRAGWMRVLTYPLHDWGTFFGPIGPDPSATLADCLQHLAGQHRDWDLLDLRWVNKVEFDHGRTSAAMTKAGYPCREQIWNTTALVDFAGTWDSYLAGRSRKFRNNLRRAESAAKRSGGVTFERYRPLPATALEIAESNRHPQPEIFEECLELAQRSWQATSLTGTTISHASVREFFRDLFDVAARAGALDINLLRSRGQLIAFSYNLASANKIVGLRIGYDRNAASYSPGRLLLARSFEDSFQRGDKQLDMGTESMAFKRGWLTRTLDSFRYTHYSAGSIRSQLLRLKHWLWPRQAKDVDYSTTSNSC